MDFHDIDSIVLESFRALVEKKDNEINKLNNIIEDINSDRIFILKILKSCSEIHKFEHDLQVLLDKYDEGFSNGEYIKNKRENLIEDIRCFLKNT